MFIWSKWVQTRIFFKKNLPKNSYTPEFASFSFSNIIWPLSLSTNFGREMYPWSESWSLLCRSNAYCSAVLMNWLALESLPIFSFGNGNVINRWRKSFYTWPHRDMMVPGVYWRPLWVGDPCHRCAQSHVTEELSPVTHLLSHVSTC